VFSLSYEMRLEQLWTEKFPTFYDVRRICKIFRPIRPTCRKNDVSTLTKHKKYEFRPFKISKNVFSDLKQRRTRLNYSEIRLISSCDTYSRPTY
jgi:hypothetical protein